MSENQAESNLTALDSLIKEPKIRRLIAATLLLTLKGAKASAHSAIVPLITSFSAYEDYLSKTYDRVSTIKTFADPNKPVKLIDHFVQTNLSNSNSKITQDDVRQQLFDSGKLVISALAGFGKSVVMRYIALSFYENPAGKIPIFIELRDLNRTTDPDLLSYIHSTYRQKSKIDKAVFERGLDQGLFVLFLDGFDEINFEHRESIQEQILQISEKYQKVGLAVSSRPDPKFSGWEKFSILNIDSMNLSQVKELIGKINHDPELKKRFLAKLSSGLYDKHRSFLSTPLLATLMMLTYQQNANIPDKMHLFYLRAFETLFDKHDTYKEQYERKRKSDLRIDQFAKLFATFCFNSYIEETFEFSKISLLQFLENAISYCGFLIKAEDFLFDLTESVCLIQLEGQFYTFVHRSFQEYFTAFFLNDCPEEFRNEFLSTFYVRPWDTVLPMLFDMSPDRIEVGWVLPNIDSYINSVNSGKGVLTRKIFSAVFSAAILRKSTEGYVFSGFNPGPFRQILSVVRAFYASEFREVETYLTVSQVDDFCENLCSQRSIDYTEFDARVPFSDSEKSITVDLASDSRYPIKNKLSRAIFEEYKAVLRIRESVGDHKVVQQKFLAKVRERQVGIRG